MHPHGVPGEAIRRCRSRSSGRLRSETSA
jgi:hypothetical protein